MAAAILRWWQQIHNGGTPTIISIPDPGIPANAITTIAGDPITTIAGDYITTS